MATGRGNVMKELHKLLRKADSIYDGQVEFVLDDGEKMNINEELEDETGMDEKYMSIFFFITPKDGLYRHARIKFHMRVNVAEYPDVAPEISCRNEIYHPNIDAIEEGEAGICVSLLSEDWKPGVGLDGAVMAVLFLFYNPQLDDALSPVCTGSEDYEDYKDNVRRSLRGEDVDGYSFDKLLDESSDTEDITEGERNVEKGIVIAAVEKKPNGAGAVAENILANVEKAEDNVLKTSDSKIEVEPEHALADNPVANDDANAVITEHITPDNEVNDVGTTVTKATAPPPAASVEVTAVTTHITPENNVLCHNADTLTTMTDAVESNQHTVFNSSLTHQNAPKCSVFKLWYSKLKDRLSPFYSSFSNKS